MKHKLVSMIILVLLLCAIFFSVAQAAWPDEDGWLTPEVTFYYYDHIWLIGNRLYSITYSTSTFGGSCVTYYTEYNNFLNTDQVYQYYIPLSPYEILPEDIVYNGKQLHNPRLACYEAPDGSGMLFVTTEDEQKIRGGTRFMPMVIGGGGASEFMDAYPAPEE